MALLLALPLFHRRIDRFRNHDLRGPVADLLGVTTERYTASKMTYDLRRLRLKGLIFQPPRTNRYFVTSYGWKVARLFSRLHARIPPCHGHIHGHRCGIAVSAAPRWTALTRNSTA
jgi:hypothetical protein